MVEEITKSRTKSIIDNCRNIGITVRPYADNGFWLSALLVFSHAVNVWHRDKQPVDLKYKRSTILCFGLFLHSICIFLALGGRTSPRLMIKLVYTGFNIALTSFLFWICLNDNMVVSIISGTFGLILYDRTYFRVLNKLPRCFTLGEATIVCQGFTLFLYNAFLSVPRGYSETKIQDVNVLYLIIQVILVAVTVTIAICHFLPFFRRTAVFWMLVVSVMACALMFPINRQLAFVILLKFLLSDTQRMLTIGLYMFLLLVTSMFVIWQINRHVSVNSATRKIFHILITAVYLPGLCYQCTTLFLASGLMLALLLLLENARIIQLKPIYKTLQDAVSCFIDEKDAGLVALTPIYLLVGCSIPMWLHPVPCDLTDSVGLGLIKLLSGVLSVGIGDTVASVCGYYLGKHKWPGTAKSVEGTLASIAAQTGTVLILFKFGFIRLNTLKTATYGAAIIVNALVEAKTNQVDNLVLPLLTYVILGTT